MRGHTGAALPQHLQRDTSTRRSWTRSLVAGLAVLLATLAPIPHDEVALAQGGVPGTLDPTFDTDGIALNELVSSLGSVEDAALLPDGRVLVLAGGRLWRFLPVGGTYAIDTSFGVDGVLALPFSGNFRTLALRPGGGFVVAGTSSGCPSGIVAKFEPNGQLTTAFDGDGVGCVEFPGFSGSLLTDVAVQDDDQILVLGAVQAPGVSQVGLARLSTTGPTVNEITQPFAHEFSDFELGEELAIRPDGNVVVLGTSQAAGSSIEVILTAYDGASLDPDPTFGSVESSPLDESFRPAALALQPDGMGMSVVVPGRNFPASIAVPAVGQLLFDEDGELSDSPLGVELDPSLIRFGMGDLVATDTGYLLLGEVGITSFADALAVVPLEREFSDPVPVILDHPAAVPRTGGAGLLVGPGTVLWPGVLEGPAGEQLLFTRPVEDTSVDPRTVTLEPSLGSAYGQDGFLAFNAFTSDRAEAVVVQPADRKPVVGGLTTSARAGPLGTVGDLGFVLRHNEDGSLDPTFGDPAHPGTAFLDFRVHGLALVPDGRIVAAGDHPGSDGPPFGVAQRLLVDGSPDPTWNDGFASGLFDSDGEQMNIRDVVVQPDGRVVVVGRDGFCVSDVCEGWIMVGRFNADGTVDDTFGVDGVTEVGFASSFLDEGIDPLARGEGIALQPDGRIVVTGLLDGVLVVARLDADGDLDPTFAAPAGPQGPGVLVDPIDPSTPFATSIGQDVDLHDDGRIVVTGTTPGVIPPTSDGGGVPPTAFVTQYLPSATRDASFGAGGLVELEAPEGRRGAGVAVDGVGNVVVTGSAGSDVLLARLTPTGGLDPAFGPGGLVATDLGRSESAAALALDTFGRIVVAGAQGYGRGGRVLTARYEPGFDLQCLPSPVEFGGVALTAGSISQSVTCTNTGAAGLTISGLAVSGAHAGDFSVLPAGCLTVLSPGASCSVQVRFDPSATGTRSALLNVAFSGDGIAGPVVVSLRGSGQGAGGLVLSPSPVDFGERLGLSTSPARTVTATNAGSAPVTISAVGIAVPNGGDFAVSGSTCAGAVLAPAASCTVSVTFTPQAPGVRSGALRVDSTASGSPHLVGLLGSGQVPTLLINPGVGAAGRVTQAFGEGFPPGQDITIIWRDATLAPGPFPEGSLSVTAGADGTISPFLVTFSRTALGGRIAVAEVGAFVAFAPYLVALGTAQPPDFIARS